MVEWGMRPLDAMIAATTNGAELLRLDDVGTVREGFRADLVLWDADPTEDPAALRRPRAVWKDGLRV
jgi:imidazolonepropionase-like amidohydrolase